jgi:hypothetical protein
MKASRKFRFASWIAAAAATIGIITQIADYAYPRAAVATVAVAAR